MVETVRWGVLGGSDFARRKMAPAIHMARGGCLSALATSNTGKVAAFTAFAPGLRVHRSYEALLADQQIDAVYIPLPNHLHAEWACRALDAGKAVLCEKPLGMDVAQIDRIMDRQARTGLLAAEAFMIVHHPQWQHVKALYESGAIGTPVMADAVYSYDKSGDPANIRNHVQSGGGGLRDIGVYTMGAVRFVTGEEPEQIHPPRLRLENGVDVWAHVTARFASLEFSSITSMRMLARQEMCFHGTEGLIRLTAPFNAASFGEARVELHRHEPGQEALSVKTWRWPAANQYVLQVEAFNAALQGGRFACPLSFSRGTQAMIDAVFAAAPKA